MRLLDDLLPSLRTACVDHQVLELALFGSALTSRFNDKSALDFTVTFLPDTVADAFTRYFSLKEKLEKVTGRNVDLVELDFVRNPHFRAELAATKQLVYLA